MIIETPIRAHLVMKLRGSIGDSRNKLLLAQSKCKVELNLWNYTMHCLAVFRSFGAYLFVVHSSNCLSPLGVVHVIWWHAYVITIALSFPRQNGFYLARPNLNVLFGRQSGTTPGYSYSAGNKNMAVIWKETTLYDYLLNPKKVCMIFLVVKSETK